MENAEKQEYVTIELSRKQIDMDHPIPMHSDKTGKDFTNVRVYAPDNAVFFYPADRIACPDDAPDKALITRHAGTEITLHYGKKGEDGEWVNESKTVLIEDLKEMYAESRAAFAEKMKQNSEFVSMTVPTEWGKHFTSKNDAGESRDFVSISIPIPDKDGKSKYYSFILAEDKFKASSRDEGMSYFSFPKHKKDDPSMDYVVTLRNEEKTADGYVKTSMDITSASLKKYVDAAKEKSNAQGAFVNVDISKKLTREFTSHDGKELVEVSVPVYEREDSEQAVFYHIVVPKARIRDTEKENVVCLSMFSKNMKGEEYTFEAKKSVKDMAGNYSDVTMTMTAADVAARFEISAAKYAKSGHSLADEIESKNNGPVANESGEGFVNASEKEVEEMENTEASRPHRAR